MMDDATGEVASGARYDGFRGVIPILQTPFYPDESLDLASLAREVEHVVECGAKAVAFPAFASEWWKLTEAESTAAAIQIVACAPPGVDVLLCVSAQSTHTAIETAKRYRDLGASGLICLAPFVMPTGGDLNHLDSVLSATDLPTMLQLSPTLTGSSIDGPGLRRLAESHANLCSIKVDSIPTGPALSGLQEAIGDMSPAHGDLTFLVGFAGLQLPDAVSRGASGLMGGSGHVREDVALLDALRSGSGEAAALFRQILPVLNFEMQSIHISAATHKTLLKAEGVIAHDVVRRPGRGLDPFQRAELDRLWREALK